MANKTKRFCAIALAALMGASVLAGCGGDPTPAASTPSGDGSAAPTTVEDPLFGEGANGPISLKVWGPSAIQDLLKQQCADFASEYSAYGDIQIEVVPQSESDAATQVLTDASSAADVFGFACDQLNRLVKSGALMEVTGADKDEVTANNSASSVAAATIDDKLYAYPETGDNSYVLMYDKSVFTDPEQVKSLESVLEVCKANNKKFAMDCGNGFYACMFMYTGGLTTDGLEDDGVTQKFSDYDEAKVVATLKAFSELFHKYSDTLLNGDASKVIDGFKSKTVAAGIDGSWDFNVCKGEDALGENAGFAILPTINVDGTDTQIVNMFGYKFIGVNSTTKYPNTAIELAKYLTNEKCQSERADIGWGPSNNVVAQSDKVKSDEAITAILSQSAYSVPQTGISDTFWTPVGTLGANLVDMDKTMTDDDYKELIKATIANVRDE